ncbi:MAG: acetyl-CoA C-acetyltransferase, partial [Gammaproteobacteria bacterium]|nr:acetyl-CoA C-acetyltransferase [Gammaproteobacteria bacterium]
CRAHSVYTETSNQDMMTATLSGMVKKFDLKGQTLGDVALGAVIKHSKDWNLARESVIGSGLSLKTPGVDMQRACGTSIEACIHIGNKIALGQIDAGIAGGTDSISDAPIVFDDRLREILLASSRGRSFMQKLSPWFRLRPSFLAPQLPSVVEPRTHLSMGESMEKTAKEFEVSREHQDQLALSSHIKAAAAYDAGFFDDLVIPYKDAEEDNNIRRDSTFEKLQSLKPVFDKKTGAGSLTAGNSTPLTDGAAAVLLASEEWAAKKNLPVVAYLTYCKVAAVNFIGDDGLLMAPAYAVSDMLKDANLSLQDFDFYEIHEAFAAQAIATIKAWQSEQFCRERLGRNAAMGPIDLSKLNVKGGSIAIGHPFAATGARVISTMAKLLNENGGGRGLVSVCTAGGMGVTAILESP